MATLTITTSGAEDARIAAAFGKYLNLPGNANAAQIKAAVIGYVQTVVRDQERAAAIAAAIVSDIAPT